MAITIKLDDLLHDRRTTLTELADRVGMTLANLSILKTGKARAIRFSTLNAICGALSCQPGDILRFDSDAEREPWPTRRISNEPAQAVEVTKEFVGAVDEVNDHFGTAGKGDRACKTRWRSLYEDSMRMSMNTTSSGSGRVDDAKSHPQGEIRGLTKLVEITEDGRAMRR
jgi:putative transcriptional regulator